jgi:hypothetical protein
LIGFWRVEEEGVAPGKDHSHADGLLVVRSVNEIQLLLHNMVSLEDNAAMGGKQLTTVINPERVSISDP